MMMKRGVGNEVVRREEVERGGSLGGGAGHKMPYVSLLLEE